MIIFYGSPLSENIPFLLLVVTLPSILCRLASIQCHCPWVNYIEAFCYDMSVYVTTHSTSTKRMQFLQIGMRHANIIYHLNRTITMQSLNPMMMLNCTTGRRSLRPSEWCHYNDPHSSFVPCGFDQEIAWSFYVSARAIQAIRLHRLLSLSSSSKASIYVSHMTPHVEYCIWRHHSLYDPVLEGPYQPLKWGTVLHSWCLIQSLQEKTHQ